VKIALAVLLVVMLMPVAAQQKKSGARQVYPALKRPPAERPVPFKAGETLTYDVSWSTYVTAGTATLSVQEKRPSFGSVAYYIVAEGRPSSLLSKLYTLYYKADTLLDAYTLLPQRGSIYSDEGGRKRMKVTRFDQNSRRAEFEVRTATIVKNELALQPFTQDALSAVYVLRAIPLKAGAKLTMPVSDSGKTYNVQLTIEGRESVKTGIGTMMAWRVKPILLGQNSAEARDLSLWLSDDARRLPLKLQAELAVGSFNLVLRDAKG
jgi:hypothetical protein